MKTKRVTRDLDPPLSGCVRVTTRGQTPALMLVYLKTPETHQVKPRTLASHRKITFSVLKYSHLLIH